MHDLIDTWLRAPWRGFGRGFWRGYGLRFPEPLEALYETDTRRERSLKLALFGAIGFCTAWLLTPVMRAQLSDVDGLALLLWRDVCAPVGLICLALMLFDPRPLLREGAMAGAAKLCALCAITLFIVSRRTGAQALVAVTTILIVYGTVGLRLRFPFAVGGVCVLIAAYAGGLRSREDIPARLQGDLVALAVSIAVCMLLVNWRLERQSRRLYLLSLREQLLHQELAMRNRDLEELTRRDPLTGLANRRAYDQALSLAWQQAVDAGSDLGLIIIDIDRFKLYNDFYGHAAGDSCLQKIGRCLGEQLRGTSDIIARFGGEEFAVLLPVLGAAACADVAERLRVAVAAMELPHRGLGRLGMVSLSAGVATRLTVGAEMTAESLFAAADAALYQAKHTGRNRVCVASA